LEGGKRATFKEAASKQGRWWTRNAGGIPTTGGTFLVDIGRVSTYQVGGVLGNIPSRKRLPRRIMNTLSILPTDTWPAGSLSDDGQSKRPTMGTPGCSRNCEKGLLTPAIAVGSVPKAFASKQTSQTNLTKQN